MLFYDEADVLPCPGLPGAGKWFLLYLNSPLSKAIQLTTAACSALFVMPYLAKESDIGPAACVAAAHSSGNGAELQSDDVGAIARRCDVVILGEVDISGRAKDDLASNRGVSTAKRRRLLGVIMDFSSKVEPQRCWKPRKESVNVQKSNCI